MEANNKNNSSIQNDTTIEEKYEENVKSFCKKNFPVILEANSLRKVFNQTLKFYEKKKCFYKEVADVKFLILTANEIERETLFSCFTDYPKDFSIHKKNIIKCIPYDGLIYSFFYINNIKVVHIEPEMTGSYSKGGTAETLKKALTRVKPACVISLGVAFGYSLEKQNLCDVLVGRQFFAYDKSTKIKDDEINIKRLHICEADQDLLTRLKSTIMFEDKTFGMFKHKFQTHIGNMLTGEYVIDSSSFKNLIEAPFKPFGIIGGEMEAFGMFSTIEKYNQKHVRSSVRGIMIKGICDWAVGKNVNIDDIYLNFENGEQMLLKDKISKEEWKNCLQTLAMCNACTVCKSFLKGNNFFSDYKTYGFFKRLRRILNRITRRSKKMSISMEE